MGESCEASFLWDCIGASFCRDISWPVPRGRPWGQQAQPPAAVALAREAASVGRPRGPHALGHEDLRARQIVVGINVDGVNGLRCFSSLLLARQRAQILARTFQCSGKHDAHKQQGAETQAPFASIGCSSKDTTVAFFLCRDRPSLDIFGLMKSYRRSACGRKSNSAQCLVYN